MKAPVSLMEFLLQTQGTFGGLYFMMIFRGIGLSKPFRLIFS